MIHLLLLLRWPVWRKTPIPGPESHAAPRTPVQSPDWWASIQPGLRARVIASRVPSCWNCGHAGVTFCPTQCDTPPGRKDQQPWKPAEPIAYVPRVIPTDAAEERADAAAARVLDEQDAERAA